MDKETLNQYRYLRLEVKKLDNRIKRLEAKDKDRVTDTVKGSNPNFPYEERTIRIEGRPYTSLEIKNKKAIYKQRLRDCKELEGRIESWIKSISDSQIRLIFDMRYIEGLSWLSISRGLGSTDESYARKIHDRYLGKI